MSDPQFIRVKKYPNRRLYDGSRSRHLTHEELYDLVVSGHTVSVTDSRTGADITNLVLMQALIERSPEKFAAFPPEVSHLLIRASEQMLRSASNNWFLQFVKSMTSVSQAAAAPFAAPFTNPFGSPFSPPFSAPANASANTPSGAPGSDAPEEGNETSAGIAAIQAKLESMAREIESLKRTKRRSR